MADKKMNRDADTGRIVTDKYVKENPKTTTAEKRSTGGKRK